MFAVCFKCGEIKWGAFNHCDKCGARPRSDDELMLSLAFTDHYFDLEKLQRIGRIIKMGNPPQLDEATKSKLSPAVQEAKMMLGIDGTDKQRTSSKHWRLFYSPGLTWPFFAAVASLVMMWTILAVNLRLVPSRDSPIMFGLLFGVLSGVVLFAIMRAFDRGRNQRAGPNPQGRSPGSAGVAVEV